MDNVVVDKSGTIDPDVIYEFLPMWPQDEFASLEDVPGRVESKLIPSDSDLLSRKEDRWVDVLTKEGGRNSSKLRRRYDCPRAPSHSTGHWWDKLTVTLVSGSRIPDLFESEPTTNLAVFVSPEFATRLKKTSFRGYRLVPVRVVTEEDEPADVALFELRFEGKPCERPMKVVGAENACPHCGHAPLICPECGHKNVGCPRCQGVAWTTRKDHRGPQDRRLIVQPPELRRHRVLEGRRWDGSDFIYGTDASPYGHFVTKRVIRWLQSIHAAAFEAIPALIDVSGMTAEQQAQLEQAKTPIGGTPPP